MRAENKVMSPMLRTCEEQSVMSNKSGHHRDPLGEITN